MAGDIAIHGEVAYPEEEPDAEIAHGVPGEPLTSVEHHNSQVLTDEHTP
jgi:hypothetical protein